ncbi:hypothetical protein STIAU_8523 [Stigmatella aurantiaca DW4/3-1]|uniref:Uncharacterized protein n=1 Tax=Stigmatella aurantiaca (strain DW4/3-1) TaxID=378806 RepID=Q09AQ5_STIAD|nr:hypothetical protein STIAU_8523 [Stigmatella aurantiaca DW4/3-1]
MPEQLQPHVRVMQLAQTLLEGDEDFQQGIHGAAQGGLEDLQRIAELLGLLAQLVCRGRVGSLGVARHALLHPLEALAQVAADTSSSVRVGVLELPQAQQEQGDRALRPALQRAPQPRRGVVEQRLPALLKGLEARAVLGCLLAGGLGQPVPLDVNVPHLAERVLELFDLALHLVQAARLPEHLKGRAQAAGGHAHVVDPLHGELPGEAGLGMAHIGQAAREDAPGGFIQPALGAEPADGGGLGHGGSAPRAHVHHLLGRFGPRPSENARVLLLEGHGGQKEVLQLFPLALGQVLVAAQVLGAHRGHGHHEEPVVALAARAVRLLLVHLEHSECPAGQHHARPGGHVPVHHRIQRVAVGPPGAGDEAPVIGVLKPPGQRSAEGEGLQLRLVLQLHSGAARRFDDDMESALLSPGRPLREVRNHSPEGLAVSPRPASRPAPGACQLIQSARLHPWQGGATVMNCSSPRGVCPNWEGGPHRPPSRVAPRRGGTAPCAGGPPR